MIDASCPHCDFVVGGQGDNLVHHFRDVHPNPLIYPGAPERCNGCRINGERACEACAGTHSLEEVMKWQRK